jgi:hypothetical protein
MYWRLSLPLVGLVWEVLENLGSGTYLEEVGHWRQVLRGIYLRFPSCQSLYFLSPMR